MRRVWRYLPYWFNLFFQPALTIGFVIGLAWLFGYVQRNHDWFANANSSAGDAIQQEDAQYACSMLCVFVKAPGRCPVCGMELQKIEVTGDPKDIYGVTIEPTARRLSNIRTVAALNMAVDREIEVLGQVTYDETTNATVSANVDGRIERMLVDFTGARIRKGDELALLYSPDLYSDQIALLQAKKSLRKASTIERVNRSNRRLYESARQRLLETGMRESQIESIEAVGRPNQRIKVYAPMSGTVVQKLVEEGKYIKTGMPILKIADLSTVWLMLEMFSEDTVELKLGQSVNVEMQSQVGNAFVGEIAFIDPMVDPRTQTVNVRIEISNDAGLIKIGDFGKAKILMPEDASQPKVVVPREAVLVNGADSIVYVETDPGRFEFRNVKVAATLGDKIALYDGIQPGEQVVASGAFMLDSTFNIQGKVSLIDPHRIVPKNEAQIDKEKSEAREIAKSFAPLSKSDGLLAESQVICPVSDVKLGSLGMGTPIHVDVNGTAIMICCEGCRGPLLENPQKYIKVLEDYKSKQPTKHNDPVDGSSSTNQERP